MGKKVEAINWRPEHLNWWTRWALSPVNTVSENKEQYDSEAERALACDIGALGATYVSLSPLF